MAEVIDTYRKHVVAMNINSFSGSALEHRLPYTHRAVEVYLEQDTLSVPARIEKLQGIIGELERTINSAHKLNSGIKAVVAADFACARNDLEGLSEDDISPYEADYKYWAVIEHLRAAEVHAQPAVKDIPYEPLSRLQDSQLTARIIAYNGGTSVVEVTQSDGGKLSIDGSELL